MTLSIRLVLVAAIAGLAATLGLLWLTDAPLGVPGEWTWTRIAYSGWHVWGWIVAGSAAAGYAWFVVAAAARIDCCGRFGCSVRLMLLAVAGFVWLGVVQAAAPGVSGLQKTHFVLYYRASSGYFWQARYEINDTREFVAGYEDLLAQQDYLHIGTHPPGLTLLFRGMLSALDASPGLTDVILATELESSREAAATIRANELTSGRELRRVDEAVLWLAAVLAMAAAATTVVPLFVLLTQCVDRRSAWCAAALWPLVPGIAVFLPKSDAVFPLISVLGPCLWLIGWRKRSLVCCALAGLTLLGGMLLSLAIAPIAVLTGLATVLHEWTNRSTGRVDNLGGGGSGRAGSRPKLHSGGGTPEASPILDPSPRPSPPNDTISQGSAARGGEGEIDGRSASGRWWLLSATAAALGFFVPVIALWWRSDLNLPRVWSWNVANHALFYENYVRTWWKWLLINPVEAGLAAGGPLAAVAIVGAVRSRGTRLFPLVAATAVVWGLLWISGKNMGEAARLWLLFQPWVVVAAAGAVCDRRGAGIDSSGPAAELNPAARNYAWFALLAVQAIACIATVTRVDGFDFDQP